MAIPICGPKLSLCCLIISVWGVVMLGLLGVFFRIQSPALAEDIPINKDEWAQTQYQYSYIVEKYNQNSTNCFVAAGAYVGVFAISFIMWRVNKRADYTMS
ncbi:hypothetical protein CAPTEDRAFT_224567 [Capitella teleta]|uniref:Uncharacterized protein n=1 Tax=Capitella teleta TaxID=283909 RepID=R7V9Y7_CAPTE|nr:hypothetical protein CAPTEDRAFT_224567 [Capitella teleta]|eukprot:ELU15414.1 hypothetical protein CAPTEDRAFT_224567 [Capitella teleta]